MDHAGTSRGETDASGSALDRGGGASETGLVRARFRSGAIISRRAAEIAISSGRFRASWPRGRFGVIPAGEVHLDVPITTVSDLSAPIGMDGGAAIIGFIATVLGGLGLMPISSPLLAVALITVGLGLMASAPRQLIRITSQSGTVDVPVSVFERPRVMAFLGEATAALPSIRH